MPADTDGSIQRNLAEMHHGRQRKHHRGRWLQLTKAYIDGQSGHSHRILTTQRDNTARRLLNPRSPLGGSLSQFAQGCQHLSHHWEPCSLARCWVLAEPGGLITCSKPPEFLQITYTCCAKWMLENPLLSLWNSSSLRILQWSTHTHNAEYRRCSAVWHFQTWEYVHIHTYLKAGTHV